MLVSNLLDLVHAHSWLIGLSNTRPKSMLPVQDCFTLPVNLFFWISLSWFSRTDLAVSTTWRHPQSERERFISIQWYIKLIVHWLQIIINSRKGEPVLWLAGWHTKVCFLLISVSSLEFSIPCTWGIVHHCNFWIWKPSYACHQLSIGHVQRQACS